MTRDSWNTIDKYRPIEIFDNNGREKKWLIVLYIENTIIILFKKLSRIVNINTLYFKVLNNYFHIFRFWEENSKVLKSEVFL